MKIGDKIKLESFENTEWTIVREFKIKDVKLYLVEPNPIEEMNKMIIDEDKSIVVLDVYDRMTKEELLEEIRIDFYEYYNHPCGSCPYYGVEECMEHMKECKWADEDAFIEEKDIENLDFVK